jgi:hypothetical protein
LAVRAEVQNAISSERSSALCTSGGGNAAAGLDSGDAASAADGGAK